MYPLKLLPALKDYLWGGDKLKTEWGKRSELPVIAESWELSAHPDGENVVVNGELAGKTLREVLQLWKGAAGKHAEKFAMFPVLVKLINSRGDLSIQVHPGDAYALEHEGQYGKTEMWYIADAEPGAGIYYGFSRDVTAEEFERAIADNSVTHLLNFLPVKAGEVYFIESGTVHAICSGLLICEIQQNSNVTYRVYDYGRLGANGKPRPLHIPQALAVANRKKQDTSPGKGRIAMRGGAKVRELGGCEYFHAFELTCEAGYDGYAGEDSFEALTFLEGSGTLGDLPVTKGDTVFVPAGYGSYPLRGSLKFLLTRV